MIGEILSGHIQNRGAVGLVCDGAIRDVGNIAKMEGFSAYSRWVNPIGPVSADGGSVNDTISVGGVVVRPGELVIGDDDGLVCLGPEDLERLIDDAEQKLELEEEWISRLEKGESISEVFELD